MPACVHSASGGAGACRSGAQPGAAMRSVGWTGGAGWGRLAPQRVSGGEGRGKAGLSSLISGGCSFGIGLQKAQEDQGVVGCCAAWGESALRHFLKNNLVKSIVRTIFYNTAVRI